MFQYLRSGLFIPELASAKSGNAEIKAICSDDGQSCGQVLILIS